MQGTSTNNICSESLLPIVTYMSRARSLLQGSEENQRAPENATHPKTQVPDRSENLRFRVCCVFGCSLFPSNRAPKTHPKTQHTRKRRISERSGTCVFGCVAFSGALRRLPKEVVAYHQAHHTDSRGPSF